MGALLALDESLTDGVTKWVVGKMIGRNYHYQWEDESDYYLGRMVGDVLGIAIGSGMSLLGVTEILASIAGGGTITFFTSGTGAAAGVTVAVNGVAVGTATMAVGATAVFASAGNYGKDLAKYSSAENTQLSNRELNKLRDKILSGNDIKVKNKEQALELIRKKFPNFKEEIAGHRSSQGWHFDQHSLVKDGPSMNIPRQNERRNRTDCALPPR